MSTLTWSIVALVVVVLVIVIAHNMWQGRQRTRRAATLGLRKGYFDDDPHTLIADKGGEERGYGRREPVMHSAQSAHSPVPASLSERPAPFQAAGHAVPRHGSPAARTGADRHPALVLEDEDYIETPFENPAAVRPWSSSESRARLEAVRRASPVATAHSHTDAARSRAVFPGRGASTDRFQVDGHDAQSPALPREPGAGDSSGDAAISHTAAVSRDEVPLRTADVYGGPVPGDGSGKGDEALSVDEPTHHQAEGVEQASAGAVLQGDEAGGQADVRLPDAQVEHVVVLEPPSPVNTDRLVALTSSLRHVGTKPVRIEVERLGGHWAPLTAGEKAVRIRFSLLLANRQGPLNAVELSDFNAAIESLAGKLQAPVTIPDIAPILRHARDLDMLAARLDTQVEVRVELPEAVEGAQMAELVRQLGLSDRGHGRYEAFADSGDSLFVLVLNKSRDQIDFVLDVPRTAESYEAWEGMVACAQRMAQTLGGRLVDSSGRGLSVGMTGSVSRQLARRYAELAQAGLTAGNAAALRVFH
ncbi:MAG: cell division protein ZipA C-terminal FtsZ-binding domain-containing protein [Lautropia sp.]|nr:cell division protein ZipA C-terminal FtsZ-binding domain-containing protein [Lautropia sp.]